MTARTFTQRAETFGFDTDVPWAANALRLVFSTPRAYQPLVDAYDLRFPGTRTALERLVVAGFVAHQGPVIVDVRDGAQVDAKPGTPTDRWAATAEGRRVAAGGAEALRARFTQLSDANAPGVLALLQAACLPPGATQVGISAAHLADHCELSDRTARWWVKHLAANKLIRKLPHRIADVRQVIPAHWRPTRALALQLRDVCVNVPTAPRHLTVEYRLSRRSFLDDIALVRVGIVGSTDYDHDVDTQRALAQLMASMRFATSGVFTIEPVFRLPVTDTEPRIFDAHASSWVAYQPDAEFRELLDGTRVRRNVVEYERHQTRRDAWSHIERFLGWLHVNAMPTESAALRFVVRGSARERAYGELLAAFADHLLDTPSAAPRQPVVLAVSTLERLSETGDPLDDRAWTRIELPNAGDDTEPHPVLHDPTDSPYDAYFARTPHDDDTPTPLST